MRIQQLIDEVDTALENITDPDEKKKYHEEVFEKLCNLLQTDSEFREDIIHELNVHAKTGEQVSSHLETIIETDETGKIFEIVFQDEDLKKAFIKGTQLTKSMDRLSSHRPDLIPSILQDESIVQSMRKNLNDIFYRKIIAKIDNRGLAELVFTNPKIYGEFDENFVIKVYSEISEKYREKMPDSLLKRALFAVSKLNVEKHEKLPKDLQEKLKNFKFPYK